MQISKIEAQPQLIQKRRVAAYCRVSTDSDDQRDSLESQKKHFDALIRLHSDWENAGIFYDFGISGTKAEARNGLQSLLQACRNGRVDYVVTKSVSRFARNTVDCLSIVRELLSYGVFIYFEKENLDTGSMESELILSVLSSLAQEESMSISKNVKWSVKKRFLNGTYKFSCAPYGYRIDENGTLAIVPEEAVVARSIFESFVSGMGTHRIAKSLNLRHIPTRKGGKWAPSTLLSILKNERYTGDALLQKTYTDSSFHRHHNHGETESYLITEHHEPIVSKNLFEQANAILQQRAKAQGAPKGTQRYQNRYCFSGKIICGECGGTFKRQIHGNDVLWICTNHLSDLSRCSMKYIRDDAVKAAFATMINKLIFAGKQLLRPFLDELCHVGNEETLRHIANLKSSLEQNAQRKDDLRKLRAKGIIDSVLFTQELCRMEQQNDTYRAELRNLDHVESGNLRKEAEKLLKYIESAEMLSEFSEELFTSFVDNIVVHNRTCIGFQLKCGLTFKEELCLGTKLKTEMP